MDFYPLVSILGPVKDTADVKPRNLGPNRKTFRGAWDVSNDGELASMWLPGKSVQSRPFFHSFEVPVFVLAPNVIFASITSRFFLK